MKNDWFSLQDNNVDIGGYIHLQIAFVRDCTPEVQGRGA